VSNRPRNCAVGPVVIVTQRVEHDLRLGEGHEHVAVQALVPQSAAKALDERNLYRFLVE